MKKEYKWARLLAYITGLVNQELLLQNEYLAAQNRILRAHLPSGLQLSDPERATLVEIGRRLVRKALAPVACVAKPDTILARYRRLVAAKFDGSKSRSYPGRPRIDPEIEGLVVHLARENPGWATTGEREAWYSRSTTCQGSRWRTVSLARAARKPPGSRIAKVIFWLSAKGSPRQDAKQIQCAEGCDG